LAAIFVVLLFVLIYHFFMLESFFAYRSRFSAFIAAKDTPSESELVLYHRARQTATRLARIPWIDAVLVCNSLSMYATRPFSDIDLLIVTAPRRLWISRICVWVVLRSGRFYRSPQSIAGSICPSFFLSRTALDISPIAREQDIYLYFWAYYVRSIFDRRGILETFARTNLGFDPEMHAEWYHQARAHQIELLSKPKSTP
jgi:hypothetical protein